MPRASQKRCLLRRSAVAHQTMDAIGGGAFVQDICLIQECKGCSRHWLWGFILCALGFTAPSTSIYLPPDDILSSCGCEHHVL